MCGLAGFLGGGVGGNKETILRHMGEKLTTRGPDDFGVWFTFEDRIGLSHRRLSIVDLSSAGHQPMTSSSERFVIAFNGEIYNHLDIRSNLESSGQGPVWRGHSDTETLLAGFDVWGVEETLRKSIGMFAFALWDKNTKNLILARDRLGEKPLYYGWQGVGSNRTFLFGSELKALKAHPAFVGAIDRGALSLLLRHNYIPAPYSIYEGIYKLEPGCLLTASLSQTDPVVSKYYDVLDIAKSSRKDMFSGSAEQAVDQLETLAKDAVRQQMMADVPLGAFLSGGIDSSAVVAMMQVQSSRPVKTFTIGFNEKGYNEASHAKQVAKYLGTEHTELYISSTQAIEVIPKLPNLYCEPFADSSQMPTFLVSQLAKEHVTVSLSGDAGDELFGGYNRYKFTDRLWSKLKYIPQDFRSLAAKGITSISPDMWDKLLSYAPKNTNSNLSGDKLHKGSSVLASRSVDQLYYGLVSHFDDPTSLVINGFEPSTKLNSAEDDLGQFGYIERMMLLDLTTYLPDDILVKVDRAAMGVSLETRVPFLDHRIVEFALSLPTNYKIRDGQTKWPLRQLLYRYVPRELIDRPKMGFGVPLGDWLRGPLRDWADELLSEDRLKSEGFFHAEPIRKMWNEHLSGKRNWMARLWTILTFQAWLEVELSNGY